MSFAPDHSSAQGAAEASPATAALSASASTSTSAHVAAPAGPAVAGPAPHALSAYERPKLARRDFSKEPPLFASQAQQAGAVPHEDSQQGEGSRSGARDSRKHARSDDKDGDSKRLRESSSRNSAVKQEAEDDEEHAAEEYGSMERLEKSPAKQKGKEKEKPVQRGKGTYGKHELVQLLQQLKEDKSASNALSNVQLECLMKLQFHTGRPAGSFVASKAKEDFDDLGGMWSHDLDIHQIERGVFVIELKIRNLKGNWDAPYAARGATHDIALTRPATLSESAFDAVSCMLGLLVHRGLLFDHTLQEYVKSVDALFARHNNSSRFSAKPPAALLRQPLGLRQPSVPLFVHLPRVSGGADEPQSVREYLESFAKLAKKAGLRSGGKKHVWREGCAAEALAPEAASAAVELLGHCFEPVGSLQISHVAPLAKHASAGGDARNKSAERETTVLTVNGKKLTGQDVFVAQTQHVKRRLDMPASSSSNN